MLKVSTVCGLSEPDTGWEWVNDLTNRLRKKRDFIWP